METVTDFNVLGSKITADGDCSHEIKRHILLGRKAMTNLESVLKSRNVTMSTKSCIVKAMVFPGVMYRCEIWTIKNVWALKSWCFWIVVLEKTLESPLDSKDIKPGQINPNGNQPWIFLCLCLYIRIYICMCVCVCAQSCPTLCNPMDCSLPGSSFHGIFQARIQKWVAISFFGVSFRPRDRTHILDSPPYCPQGFYLIKWHVYFLTDWI